MMMKLPVLLVALAAAVVAQTQVDLRTQSKSVDFSNATLTKPAKVGSVLPAVCGVGEVFFNTSATPGLNLYICTATNIWQALGPGGSAGGGAATSTSTSTVSSLPGACSVGDVRYATDATLAGGGFNLYWCTAPNSWSQFGYVAGGSGALSSSCAFLPCSIDITAAVPLKAGANVWTGSNDFSGAARTAPFQISATDPATCNPAGRPFFFNTTSNTLKFCNAVNAWTIVGRAGGGLASVFYGVGVNNSTSAFHQMNWGVDAGGPALTCSATAPSPCYLTMSNTGLPVATYLTLVAPSVFSTLSVTVEWFANSTAAGNISLQVDAQCLSRDSTAVIGVTPTWTGAQNATTANNTSTASVRRQTVFTGVGTCSAGDMVRVRVQRVAGGDTYADVIRFLGASVSY
jgi:hypothetical protein